MNKSIDTKGFNIAEADASPDLMAKVTCENNIRSEIL